MSPDIVDFLTRIGMAFVAGFVLGFERERHGRAAGLRTTVLVCVAAAIAGILSDVYYVGSFSGRFQSPAWHPDPARLGAGILTGIGFIGAGAILRHGNLVRGVTTASQIWFVTILGLCFGAGQLLLGIAGTTVSMLTVFGLRRIEAHIQRDWYASLTVIAQADGVAIAQIREVVEKAGIIVKNLEINHDVAAGSRTITLALRYKRNHQVDLPEAVISRLIILPGVMRAVWR